MEYVQVLKPEPVQHVVILQSPHVQKVLLQLYRRSQSLLCSAQPVRPALPGTGKKREEKVEAVVTSSQAASGDVILEP